MEPLPFPDDSMDVLLAGLVFPYITYHNGHRGVGALLGLLKEAFRVLREGGVLVWSTPKPDSNFWAVLFASWKDILDFRHPENLLYAPILLAYALTIQRKGRKGIYTFPSEQSLWVLHEAIGFSQIVVCRSLADQVFLIRAVKGKGSKG